MAKLIYIANVSLDGFVEDENGSIEWSAPDDEQFTFVTDLVRPAGTYLYGRRMYETMTVWETDPTLAAESKLMADFADIWQAADKIVYSTTLDTPSTTKTRIERDFDPDSVRALKTAAVHDLDIGGANLAAQAFKAGVIDECHVFIYPLLVGRGKPAFSSEVRATLELFDERRFDNGIVYAGYRIKR
jgi:dihydrofolate reductase